jgi:hypothetical protein
VSTAALTHATQPKSDRGAHSSPRPQCNPHVELFN